MGNCVGKGAHSKDNVVEHDRRRGLSVSKAEKVAKDPKLSESRGTVKTAGEGNILDLFPNAARRSSLCGLASDVQQKGFADKTTARCGEESWGSFKIGYACKKGLKPESPNQDDFCIFRMDATSIFGVFDGHGPYGHDISNFVQMTLPRSFVQDPNFAECPEKALAEAFPETHRLCTSVESQTEGHFDCALSGTTATLAMHREGFLYVAHVGDSRAVLARKPGSEFEAEELTEDHKPTCETERKRIQAYGGQVKRLEGDIPHRVFLSGKMYPGLAMTRSIGDTVGATAGVTSIPEVKSVKVKKDCRFLLMCSDGIWEFINTQEAVNIVARYPSNEVQKAADFLALEAWNRWIKEEVNVVDDITVIIAWFNDD
mmetsp:Transcript_101327/g.326991  ORF Transcript_101327/g.326991 Transcript_101327/m.326991 type:complete len:372 (-) Transcript_101327:152-1267(-)